MSDFYCDEVLSGRTPVRRVLETDTVLAYHHTRPSHPVHIVVIPKRHIESLLALTVEDQEVIQAMMTVIQQVAAGVVATYGACRVITNLGRYQESKHLHWHIVSGPANPVSGIGNER